MQKHPPSYEQYWHLREQAGLYSEKYLELTKKLIEMRQQSQKNSLG